MGKRRSSVSVALKVGMPNKDIEKGSSCVDTWGGTSGLFSQNESANADCPEQVELETGGDGESRRRLVIGILSLDYSCSESLADSVS